MSLGDAMMKRRELEKQLISTFIQLEGFDFGTLAKIIFFEKYVTPKVFEIIKEHADSDVTLISVTNMDYIQRKLTLDFYKSFDDKEKNDKRGEITITFCTCGTNFSAIKRVQGEDVVLYSGACHNNELWNRCLKGE